jgi:hypothetical protein
VPTPCAGCHTPDRLELDRQLAAGIPTRALSERYGISHAALQRHRQFGHISDLALSELHGKELQRTEAIAAQGTDLYKRVKKLLVEAESAQHHGVVLKAVREAVRCLDLLARLLPPPHVSAQLEDQILRINDAINGAVDEFFAGDLEAAERFQKLLAVRFERAGL